MSPNLPVPDPADFEDELRPWERRLDLHETEAAYHVFCHFRDLPREERAVNRAYTIHQELCRKNQKAVPAESQDSPGLMDVSPYWKECKKRYRWEERIALYAAWSTGYGRIAADCLAGARPGTSRLRRPRFFVGEETMKCLSLAFDLRGGPRFLGVATRRKLRRCRKASSSNRTPRSNCVASGCCRCGCGRDVVVGTVNLARKKNPTRSCGCRHLRPLAPPPIEVRVEPLVPDTPERTTTPQQALDRFHSDFSAIGPVRRVTWPVDENDEAAGVIGVDFDPFTYSSREHPLSDSSRNREGGHHMAGTHLRMWRTRTRHVRRDDRWRSPHDQHPRSEGKGSDTKAESLQP